MKKSNLLIAVLVLISSAVFAQTIVQDTKPVQFTFNYPMGTNGYKSYQSTNNLSVNMMIGFNGGVKGCEVAGMGNINNGDITGVQASGMWNVAKGSLKGGQFAGMFNSNTGSANGIQGAGLFNANLGSANGIQAAGIFNFNKDDAKYIQAAGIFNSNYGKAEGLQAAGIFNSNLCQKTDSSATKLIQVAGIANQNSSVTTGLQASGIINVSTDSLTGIQTSLVNLGSYVKGVQVGLVNVCTKESDKVVPIGLVNIVKGGLFEFEVAAGDVLYGNINYKMGVEKFYTIYKIGYSVFEGTSVYSTGLGLGTYFKLNDKSKIALDLSTNSITDRFLISNEFNMLNKADISYKYSITDNFGLFAGLSYNIYLTDAKSDNPNGILNVPYTIAKSANPNVNVFNWFGANVGLSVRL